MGGHVFLECMSFRMTCLMRAYVWKVMCWWTACLQDGISYDMLCFIGRHFLLDNLFHLSVCIIGGHVLQFVMSYWNTHFTGVHILQDDLSNRRAPLR